MPQIINTNIQSLTAQRNLNKSQSSMATAMERLSSGLRINSAKDDAAGLAISERMTSQVRGLNQAIRNANDGISFAQTGEGALSTMGDAIQRIRELAVQSVNDTNSSSDRQALNNEVAQLIGEVNRIADTTQFNGQNILDGSTSTLTFQVGANQGQTIAVDGVDARGSQLGANVGTGSTLDGTVFAQAGTDGDVLTVNGQNITLDANNTASTQAFVDAINAVANDSGVTAAKASSTSVALAYTADTDDARTLTVNNVGISVTAGMAAADLATAINDVSAQTGVTASNNAGTITFSNTTGADISIAQDADPDDGGTDNENIFAGLNPAGAGDAVSVTYKPGVQLSTEVGGNIVLSSSGTIADLGLNGFSASDKVLSAVNVLTSSGATDALATLDFALEQVTSLRATLGATQVRFESTISNLSVSSENLSAARSRIRDADFAAETAEMTRSQILQQAGVAMVSQANALPQSVLSLLQ
ncbi:flagellin [Sedimenticola selenatireducens]|uniref:Flagellin n=1 Tax=Sedimenticola selenatireducens TaxID=191960 RepID=A0A2N6CRT7_9GAMM|nr:flagellin [Sedimenticola selenatireducens]PLX59791.1 MAG: flagellin [Sedimenticola selenatireducens]